LVPAVPGPWALPVPGPARNDEAMATTLDVLVIESRPGAADHAATLLTRAGHRIHRCYGEGERGFPCRGVRDPTLCPLDQGVDVAVLVRPRLAPRPTGLESGVSCALRSRIPLVENGPEALDPFTPWVRARVADGTGVNVVETCVEAAETRYDELVDRIRRRTLRTMAVAAARPGPLDCAIERRGGTLHVTLSGPPVGKDVEHALAIRVADAVRAEHLPHTTLDITYHPASI
jgi:hypothetical protein